MSKNREYILIPKLDIVFDCLRRVPQYSSINDVYLRQIDLEAALPLARYIVDRRLAFATKVFSAMSDANIELYRPIFFRASNDHWRLIVPPIVEKHNNEWYIFDGLHRLWLAKNAGLLKPWVLCITEPPMELPSTPRSWDQIVHTHTQHPVTDNLLNMDESLIRPLSRYFKSTLTLYQNIDDDLLDSSEKNLKDNETIHL